MKKAGTIITTILEVNRSSGGFEIDSRATNLVLEFLAHREHCITNLLRIETSHTHAPKEFVRGIVATRFGRRIINRGALIGLRGHDEADQFFDTPAVFHESSSEIVE